MYASVDAALEDAYRFGCLRIEPQNNTAKVMDRCVNKGAVGRGGSSLTQSEWHANAAMIQAKVERALNRYELAAVQMQYSEGLKIDGIINLATYICQKNKDINMLTCAEIIVNIFTCRPKQTAIMDKYDLSKGKYYRYEQKIRRVINELINRAVCKLDAPFQDGGLVKYLE